MDFENLLNINKEIWNRGSTGSSAFSVTCVMCNIRNSSLIGEHQLDQGLFYGMDQCRLVEHLPASS